MNGQVFRLPEDFDGNAVIGLFSWLSIQNPKSKIQNVYLMTLSARASTFAGIVRSICFAAFKLMMKSNFFGCSTGRSPGLAPFRILSTYVAARRNKSVKLVL